ncbi:phage virion morphogenesis protein [Phreatobacter stygius]|uniref:Phage virion morphogenesis protein n=1 Tax=Phreatobacter stygius TaxID=1940610 RepID=A0A4D7B5D9_9HYPH|nr:phage virion morphogenesis protein [Phreatobacter stygius]QCI65638.1 phage virion morphogenesis protein [Phreatobacter stygius]
MAITISINSATADAMLADLAGRTSNLPGALKNIGETLVKVQRRRFMTGTDPQGKKWAPLSPLTVELRGSSGPVLNRSGRLMNSSAYQVSGSTLHVGLNTIDAAVHQFGATIVPKKAPILAIPSKGGFVFLKKAVIPARPIVGFGPEDERAARDTITEWLALDK